MVIDLEKYENMPFRESKSAFCARKYKYLPYYFHKGNSGINKNPYNISKRILKTNIGKSFDLAFSYYCSKVEKRFQYIFLEDFQEKYRGYYKGFGLDYIVDENGNIQDIREKKPKKEISIKFDNYQTEFRHKITGHKKEDFTRVFTKKEVIYKRRFGIVYKSIVDDKFLYYEYGTKGRLEPINMRYRAKESDFIPVCISGSIQYFESKNNPRFKRYFAELRKNSKSKFKHEREEQRKTVELGLLSKFSISKSAKKALKKKMEAERREKEKLAKEEMKLTLQRKGFRPNAFTNKPD